MSNPNGLPAPHGAYRAGRARRRGQPVVALAVLLGAWIGARAALIHADAPAPPGDAASLASADQGFARSVSLPEPAQLARGRERSAVSGLVEHPLPPHRAWVPVRGPVGTAADDAGPPPAAPRIAGGHQLLWLAGLAAVALPPEVAALQQRGAGLTAALRPDNPQQSQLKMRPEKTAPLRWSADGWVLWRQGGNGYQLQGAGLIGSSASGGAYGASQAGVVVRYRLAPPGPSNALSRLGPVLYLRGTSALRTPRGEELAAGLAVRPGAGPSAGIPASLNAEVRATRGADGVVRLRPAAGVVSEFPPLPLPLGLRGEAYLAAGYVGGRDATAFADGQARVDARIAGAGPVELRAGGGAWGGAQRGAERLDLGPAVTIALPLGPARARLSADWRFRVAGDAVPGNGAALTLSAGF